MICNNEMTRKHFNKAMAEKLAELKDASAQEDGRLVWMAACVAMATACKQFNGRFDSSKFLLACGFNSEDFGARI